MIKICPICGKEFEVLYPDIWRFKRQNRHLCSWSCLRVHDNRRKEDRMNSKNYGKRARMSREDMDKAVRMWRDGNSSLDQFLTDHGITNVRKWKQNAKIRYKDQPTVELVYDESVLDEYRQEHPEELQVAPVTGPVVIDTPAGDLPVMLDDLRITAVSHPEFGEFCYSARFKTIDWRDLGGDEVSMPITGWRNLVDALPKILRVLGVKV